MLLLLNCTTFYSLLISITAIALSPQGRQSILFILYRQTERHTHCAVSSVCFDNLFLIYRAKLRYLLFLYYLDLSLKVKCC